jgi:hypothetical protein
LVRPSPLALSPPSSLASLLVSPLAMAEMEQAPDRAPAFFDAACLDAAKGSAVLSSNP